MNDQDAKTKTDAKAMPPPPPPRPSLLDQEVEDLRRCLQTAAVKTGQIYGFYADTHRLGIAKHTKVPPQSLTSSLGRELERYDQLCDIIEGNLLRAIAVLQRDLRREEQKEEAIRLEAQKKSAEAPQQTRSPDELPFLEPAPPNSAEFIPTNPRNSPTHPGVGSINARRPSAISISSLQRPSLPPKLDLTSSMRTLTEEASGIYTSGLSSPVTLAPKSARPIEPDDLFMAAYTTPVDNRPVIDLTLTENNHGHALKSSAAPSAGDSSDKPIELDLDMDMDMSMDLFGDNSEVPEDADLPEGVENVFTIPSAEGGTLPDNGSNKAAKESDFIDLTAQDIFASLSNHPMGATQSARNTDVSAPVEAPSPATLLAASFPHHLSTSASSENNSGLLGSDQPFDLTSLGDLGDLSVFNSTSEFSSSDLDAFFITGGGSSEGVQRTSGTEQPSA